MAACVSEDGTNGLCADGVGLGGAYAVAVSPDGASVFVASQFNYALAVFDRDPYTGELTQKPGAAGCIHDGTHATCALGAALQGPVALAVSPDGRSIYVASVLSDAVTVFARDLSVYDLDGDGQVEPLTHGILLDALRVRISGSGAGRRSCRLGPLQTMQRGGNRNLRSIGIQLGWVGSHRPQPFSDLEPLHEAVERRASSTPSRRAASARRPPVSRSAVRTRSSVARSTASCKVPSAPATLAIGDASDAAARRARRSRARSNPPDPPSPPRAPAAGPRARGSPPAPGSPPARSRSRARARSPASRAAAAAPRLRPRERAGARRAAPGRSARAAGCPRGARAAAGADRDDVETEVEVLAEAAGRRWPRGGRGWWRRPRARRRGASSTRRPAASRRPGARAAAWPGSRPRSRRSRRGRACRRGRARSSRRAAGARR